MLKRKDELGPSENTRKCQTICQHPPIAMFEQSIVQIGQGV